MFEIEINYFIDQNFKRERIKLPQNCLNYASLWKKLSFKH